MRKFTSVASSIQSAVFCYGSPSKLMQPDTPEHGLATTLQSNDCTRGHWSQRNEDMSTQKPVHKCAITTFYVTAPNCKQPRCSLVGKWLNPHHWASLSNKEERTTDRYNNLNGSPKNRAEWKEPSPKGDAYDSIYITLLKWQHYRTGEQMRSCRDLRAKGGRDVGGTIKGQQDGSLWWRKCFASWLQRRQHSPCDTVPEFCKTVPAGVTR